MAVKLTEHPLGHMIDFGDDVRIERTHLHVRKEPLLDDTGAPMKTSTGQAVHTHVPHVDSNGAPVVDDKGDPIWMWNVYQRVANEKHPERDGFFKHAFHGDDTTDTHTWLHVIEGTEAEARAKALQLVGE
jgi:hypothetical protein